MTTEVKGTSGAAARDCRGADRASDALAMGTGYFARPSPTVTAAEISSADTAPTTERGPRKAADALWRETGRRRLTALECAILQAFPANWPFQARTSTSLYRLIGNAVPPPLAMYVASMIELEEACSPY